MSDGHEGTIPQTKGEIREALAHGLVSLDANVLLSFYRFSPSARQGLISVLEALGDRVFVSHQAAREFWRNRLSAIDARTTAIDQLTTALEKGEKAVQDAVRVWSKQTAADEEVEQRILKAISSAVKECKATAEEATIESDESATFAYEAGRDAVAQALLQLLDGRVGPPLEPVEHAKALKEAQRRTDEGAPPGFMDRKKEEANSEDGASGDYLVWLQSMLEAERRALPLILVTSDEKEDWWWKHRSQLLGPRRELVQELEERCHQRLIMVRPPQLIDHADVLKVTVTDDVRSDVERGTSSESPVWTERAVTELLTRLDDEGREQAPVIRAAAQGGGLIERDDLYEICAYPSDRMLRGFTRPTARITADLQREGYLDEGVEPMLTPLYEGGVTALRFAIPQDVVAILTTSR